jgi:membrane protein required for colicin V production
MPSYLDLALIAVVLISGVLSLLRGFTREVLAIGSWAAAAFAAFYLHPILLPYVKPHIAKESIALAVAIGAVFLVTLVIVSMITVRISDAILDSKIGALDRSLGFIFGAARGLLLCVVAFLFFNWLVPEKTQPDWVREAKTRPLLQSSGETLMALLPEDPLSAFQQRMKRNREDEVTPEEPELRTAPSAAPGRRS